MAYYYIPPFAVQRLYISSHHVVLDVQHVLLTSENLPHMMWNMSCKVPNVTRHNQLEIAGIMFLFYLPTGSILEVFAHWITSCRLRLIE